MLGTWELILIVAVLILIFGAKRIPDIARSIGRGIREFRKGLEEREDLSVEEEIKEDKEKD